MLEDPEIGPLVLLNGDGSLLLLELALIGLFVFPEPGFWATDGC